MSTMSDRQKSCEERIAGELTSRLEDIGNIWKTLDEESSDNDAIEGAYEDLDNFPLSVGKKTVYTVLISTGGPADWFEATVDEDGAIERIEYVYQDWFDGARLMLDLESDEGKIAEWFCSYFIEVAE